MRTWLKTMLILSLASASAGVIGTAFILKQQKISTEQYYPYIVWHLGFSNVAAKWPFVFVAGPGHLAGAGTEIYQHVFWRAGWPFIISNDARVFECSKVYCPVEKMTEIAKTYVAEASHTPLYESTGGLTPEIRTVNTKMNEELVKVASNGVLKWSQDDQMNFLLGSQRGVWVLIDGRGQPTLLWFTRLTAFGVLSLAVCIVLWLRRLAVLRK
jgi:hypothetical protein